MQPETITEKQAPDFFVTLSAQPFPLPLLIGVIAQQNEVINLTHQPRILVVTENPFKALSNYKSSSSFSQTSIFCCSVYVIHLYMLLKD